MPSKYIAPIPTGNGNGNGHSTSDHDATTKSNGTHATSTLKFAAAAAVQHKPMSSVNLAMPPHGTNGHNGNGHNGNGHSNGVFVPVVSRPQIQRLTDSRCDPDVLDGRTLQFFIFGYSSLSFINLFFCRWR